MTDPLLQTIEQEESSSLKKNQFFQIDFLKAVMIFLVIFDHYVYWDVKSEIG